MEIILNILSVRYEYLDFWFPKPVLHVKGIQASMNNFPSAIL